MEKKQKAQASRTRARKSKMKDLKAYTGDFDPDLKLENLSKEVLANLQSVAEQIEAWLGLAASSPIGDLETCPKQHKQQACRP